MNATASSPGILRSGALARPPAAGRALGTRRVPQRSPAAPSRAAPPPPTATPIVDTARALYEQAWSTPGGHAYLDSIVADDHVQCDEVWQQGVCRVGRDKLAKGMRHMRRIYPDLAFTVNRAAAAGEDAVFVEWALTGTFEGEAHTATGLSVLSFAPDGRVASTRVYRQALPAEVVLARRTKGEVAQGVLLNGGDGRSGGGASGDA